MHASDWMAARFKTCWARAFSAENFLSANGKEMGFTSSSWLIFQCFRSVPVARKNVGISGFFTESRDILETSLGFLQILQWALGHRIRYTEGWLLGFSYDFPMILSSNADSMVLASEHLRGIHPDIIQNGGHSGGMPFKHALARTIGPWRQHFDDEWWRGSGYSSRPSVCLILWLGTVQRCHVCAL